MPACDDFLFNANALFLRATTFCRRDYLDTKAGYVALAGAKGCAAIMDEQALKSKTMAALKRLDGVVNAHGKKFACKMVEDMEQHVEKGER